MNRAFICYGQGGSIVGPALAGGDGPKTIASKLAMLGWKTSLHEWDDGLEIANEVKKLSPTDKLIIGGTSLGANEAPATAFLCKRRVDMIFGIQPSLYGRRNQISSNVARALCFYNPYAVITGGLGAYAWSRAAGNKSTTLYTWQSWATHPGDTLGWIHDAIISHARKL